jgi:hypothetical protein
MPKRAQRTRADIYAAIDEACKFLNTYILLGYFSELSMAEVSRLKYEQHFTALHTLYYGNLSKLRKLAELGSPVAIWALKNALIADTQDGPLTEEKQELLEWLLFSPPQSKKGRGRTEKRDRNIIIASAVRKILALGFKATRNEATKADNGVISACQIVATTLTHLGIEMTERAVERTWGAYKDVKIREDRYAPRAFRDFLKDFIVGPRPSIEEMVAFKKAVAEEYARSKKGKFFLKAAVEELVTRKMTI